MKNSKTYKVTFIDYEPMIIEYAYNRDNAIDKAMNRLPNRDGQTKSQKRKRIESARKIK